MTGILGAAKGILGCLRELETLRPGQYADGVEQYERYVEKLAGRE